MKFLGFETKICKFYVLKIKTVIIRNNIPLNHNSNLSLLYNNLFIELIFIQFMTKLKKHIFIVKKKV